VNLHPGKRIKRFSPVQRLFHLMLMLSFVTQGMTGLGRLYEETPWGQGLAGLFGGAANALLVHKWVGIFMLILFGAHLVYVASRIEWRRFPASVFGPDSLLPRPRDLGDFFRHIGWFLGLRPAPRLDRWGYWEKFDYWAVFWGMVILGGTGLIQWEPLATSRYLPGWIFNVSLWVHRIEAMLAMVHVFVIHFFVAHLRRSHFPMDRAIFQGTADFDIVAEERPAWVERLEAQGALTKALVQDVPAGLKVVIIVFGYLVVATAWFLLIGGLLNFRYVTW